MVEGKNNIKRFLIEKHPFGYVPKRQKQVMNEVLSLNRSSRKYTYQYLNESYYRENILMICMDFVLKCLKDDKKLSIDSLKLNDPLEYNGQYYFFEGHDDKTCTLRSNTRRRNPVTLTLPIKKFEEFAHKTKTVKKRRSGGYLREFAQYFNLDLKGLANVEQIAILLPANIYKELMKTSFLINRKKLFFSQLCASSYLTSNGNMKGANHTDSTETPFVLFSSSANELINYIDNGELSLRGIFAFGNQWFSENNLPQTLSLPDLAEENDCSCAFFSSNEVISNKDTFDLIKSMGANRNWLFEYGETLTFKSVLTNTAFKTNVSEIFAFLEEIDENPAFHYLSRLTWNAVRISSSSASRASTVLDQQITQIEEYIHYRKIEDKLGIINNLRLLLKNRFGAQMKKMIRKIVNNKSQYALIVADSLKEEYKSIFTQDNIITFSFKDQITEDMYDRFNTAILVNPYAHERIRWTRSFISTNIVIMVPEYFLNSFQLSIRAEKRMILKAKNELDKNIIMENSYEKSLDHLLVNIKKCINKQKARTTADASNEIIDNEKFTKEIETNRDEILPVDEVYKARINLRANELSDHHTDNTLVEVHKVFQLTKGYQVYSTDKAILFTVTQDGLLVRRSVDDISNRDKIVDFEIPYSDAYYRDWFRKVSEGKAAPRNEDEKKDFRWKREFINYINRHEYTVAMLQRKMELAGASHHTKSYYKTWSDVKKMPILPRETQFIRYVGQLIGDNDIYNNYQDFYQSSEKIKQVFSESREDQLSSMNNKKLHDIGQKYQVGQIISVKNVQIPDVPRFMTNTLVRG